MQRKRIHMMMLAGGLLGGMLMAMPVMAADPAPAAPSAADAEKAAKEKALAEAKAAAPADGAMLANTCAGCHGTNGVSAGPSMPSIAGMPAKYLEHIMSEFQSGKRPSTIMGRIAKGYTEEETKRIAEYLSKAKWQPVKSGPNSLTATKVDEAKGKKGKKVIESSKCGKCHEDEGVTQDEDTPRVAGQWVDYLVIKMQDFKNEHLSVPQPEKMKKAIDKLSAEELESAAHFYAGQK
ncbi:MAG: c-type cytochrome [Magnetococcales bacterium]|nr:c-type cytochrome [Magnetococcales bacterium]